MTNEERARWEAAWAARLPIPLDQHRCNNPFNRATNAQGKCGERTIKMTRTEYRGPKRIVTETSETITCECTCEGCREPIGSDPIA